MDSGQLAWGSGLGTESCIFRCTCEVCELADELSEEDDKLRAEAADLSVDCQDLSACLGDEQMLQLLAKAERWLELCLLLKYKVTHQIEAADAVFSLAMMVGQVDKAREVAEQGMEMAVIRFGEENIMVEDWKRRKDDPVLYMIG